MQRKQVSPLVMVLIFGVLLAGCQGCFPKRSFVSWGYSILDTATITYNTGMGTVADMYKRGMIGDEDKATAIEVGNKYRASTEMAIEALASYAEYSERQKQDHYTEMENIILSVNGMGVELFQLIAEFQKKQPSPTPATTEVEVHSPLYIEGAPRLVPPPQ